MPFRDWLDGSVILTGPIDNIMNFIENGLTYDKAPIHPTLIENRITFPEDFIAENLFVHHTHGAYIGLWPSVEVRETYFPNIYQVIATWDCLHGTDVDDLRKLAKKYELMFEIEGYLYNLEIREVFVVDKHGNLIFKDVRDVVIPENTDNYFLNPHLELEELIELSNSMVNKDTKYFLCFNQILHNTK